MLGPCTWFLLWTRLRGEGGQAISSERERERGGGGGKDTGREGGATKAPTVEGDGKVPKTITHSETKRQRHRHRFEEAREAAQQTGTAIHTDRG